MPRPSRFTCLHALCVHNPHHWAQRAAAPNENGRFTRNFKSVVHKNASKSPYSSRVLYATRNKVRSSYSLCQKQLVLCLLSPTSCTRIFLKISSCRRTLHPELRVYPSQIHPPAKTRVPPALTCTIEEADTSRLRSKPLSSTECCTGPSKKTSPEASVLVFVRVFGFGGSVGTLTEALREAPESSRGDVSPGCRLVRPGTCCDIGGSVQPAGSNSIDARKRREVGMSIIRIQPRSPSTH